MGLGSELLRLGLDRADRFNIGGRDSRAARLAGEIPRDIDAVTAAWLSAALHAPVSDAEIIDRTAGTTERARFSLTTGTPDPTRLMTASAPPTSVFVKLAPQPAATRLFVGLVRLGATEVSFYRSIRPQLPIEAPRAHAALYDPRRGRFALVLDDLTVRGCRFADVRDAPSSDEAEAVVVALATLHAAFASGRTGGAESAELAWVPTHVTAPAAALTSRLLRLVIGRLRKAEPGRLPAGTELLIEQQREFERRLPADDMTLLHGDPHYGNVYFDGDTPGFFDWQVLRRGLGLRDLAYFMTVSLPTEQRRQSERELLALYLDEVARRGGPVLDPVESWRRYRLLVAYAFVAAAFTLAAGGLQAAEIAGSGLDRASAAMTDLDTMDEVRHLLA